MDASPAVDAGLSVDVGPDVQPSDPGTKWATAVNLIDLNRGTRLAVDGAHNILVTGFPKNPPSKTTLVKLDPKGNVLFEKGFVAPNGTRAHAGAVAADSNSNIYVLYTRVDNVDFGGGLIQGQDPGGMLVKFDANGNFIWQFAVSKLAYFARIAARPNGNVLLGGELAGDVTFGTTTLSPVYGDDILVVEVSASGTLVNAQKWGGPGLSWLYGLVLDGVGNAYIAGTFNGTIDFGKGPMTGPVADKNIYSDHSVFLAKLDSNLVGVAQRDGASTNASDRLEDLAIDAKGNLEVGGEVTSSIKLGPQPVVASGVNDLFFAYLDPSLGHIWSKSWGGTPVKQVAGVAARPGAGGLVAVGGMNGQLSFGLGALPNTYGFYAVQFDALGNALTNSAGTFPAWGGVYSIEYLEGTDFVTLGGCAGWVQLPSGPLDCGDQSLFVARFAP